mgnify:CR=1 FL=1
MKQCEQLTSVTYPVVVRVLLGRLVVLATRSSLAALHALHPARFFQVSEQSNAPRREIGRAHV